MFYGYYRAVRKPGMSVVLTVISLGTRVVLAYVLSAVPQIGVSGIWSAVRSDGFWQILQDGFIIRNYNKDEYIMEMRVNKWRKK